MGKQIIKPRFVDGLLFDPTWSRVVLIRKTKPEWQAGLLNCVGGKIEPGEDIEMAMIREFREETGVSIGGWKRFLDMKLIRNNGELYCFYNTGNVDAAQTQTEEDVIVMNVAEVMNRCDTIPNLRWMIQMARSFQFGESALKFSVQEMTKP